MHRQAHPTLPNKKLTASLDIELMFLPPYTPELNSIEALWVVIKREFK
jgi:transposase